MAKNWKTTYSEKEIEWISCPLCESSRYMKRVEEWSLGIVRCLDCGLYYVNPRLKDSEKNYWGERDNIVAKYRNNLADPSTHSRDSNNREHLKMLRKFKPGGKLLDVGPYLGFFLNLAKQDGWETYGIEPS